MQVSDERASLLSKQAAGGGNSATRGLIAGFLSTVATRSAEGGAAVGLRELDDLKQAVQNASLEQKDPLVIYKLESFNLFREMIMRSNKEIISFLMQGGLPKEEGGGNGRPQQQTRFTQEAPKQKKERLRESREMEEASAEVAQKPKQQPVKVGARVGRNDPCPCGSGKKYKNCHGAGGG